MMYRHLYHFLLRGLRGQIELDTMTLWDKVRYVLVMRLPLPGGKRYV